MKDIILTITGSRFFHAAVLLLIAVAADRLLNRRIIKFLSKRAQNRKEDSAARYKTLFSVLSKAITITIGTLTFIWLLQILFDINPASIIAATGVVGVALSLGAQSLVKDSINGFFILMEDQYSVGDLVTIEGFLGYVRSVNLRMTCIEAFSGDKMYIPNGSISKVVNHFKENRSIFIKVPISYDADIDEAVEQLREIAAGMEMPYMTAQAKVHGVDELDTSSVNVLVEIPCEPKEQYRCKREALQQIRSEMARRGMEIPYEHITVVKKG